MKDFKKSGGFAKKRFASSRPSFGVKRDFGAKRFDAPLERHQATCASCHKLCEVPFKPNGKKPVYCRDCFKSQEAAPSTYAGHVAPGASAETSIGVDLKKQFSVLGTKLDKLIAVIEAQTEAISNAK